MRRNCETCCATGDERDMLGCVAVERNEHDIGTHYMCKTCTKQYSNSLLTNSTIGKYGTGLPCGTQGCNRVLLWAPVKQLLEEKVWKILETRMDSAALQPFGEIEYCKYCDFGIIIDQTKDRMQFFPCQKPGCLRQFCRLCRVDFESHCGKPCNYMDVTQNSSLHAMEEKLSSLLIRCCPKCGLKFVKDGGCNSMTCPCSNTMCYLCRVSPITENHFSSGGCSAGTDAEAYNRAQREQLLQSADPDIRKSLQDM